MEAEPSEKSCAVCGRTIEWRKKWARDWAEVRYCSRACSSARLAPVDHALEQTILELLARRGAGKTICPSEAARALESGEEAWRALMGRARWAANRLVARGEVVITQGGRVVDPSTARGPIRLRRA
jgi:hypothetical protein